jgi:hypothetical protein
MESTLVSIIEGIGGDIAAFRIKARFTRFFVVGSVAEELYLEISISNLILIL